MTRYHHRSGHPARWQRFVLAALLAACGPSRPAEPERAHPTQLVGRWVLRHEDGSWGDTLSLEASGGVQGSRGNAVPSSARWWVQIEDGPRFCVSDAAHSSCREYDLEGDQLVLRSTGSQTVFRRVADAGLPDSSARRR